MRLALLVGRQGTNRVLSGLVNKDHEHTERQSWHSVMHEDVVPGSEGNIERLEITNQHN